MKSLKLATLLLTALVFILSACNNGSESPESEVNQAPPKDIQLFELKNNAETGVTFSNTVIENDEINFFIYEGVHQGAGVASADFNNDGLIDLFFTGNMSMDRLYINKGNWKFEDISQTANVNKGKGWSYGVAVADVNNDGWMDLYVSKFLLDNPELLKNQLYINNKDLTFTESAEQYGIADAGYGVNANFFDYDKDGWLDLYVANQPPTNAEYKKKKKGTINYTYTDKLYRNNGNGTFSDVTQAAGITNYSFTLSATTSDLNNDGWPDIYVACDYEEPDIIYMNNGDGTFSNTANEAIKHMSNFSMGADLADFNNDGWLDIYTGDMVSDNNRRLKTNMSGMNPQRFWELANNGYHHQYMFNALQLNNGNGTYSEIAQMAGVARTDWTWSTLFADFDNDGFKDLFITNGVLRDANNNDLRKRIIEYQDEKKREAKEKGIPLELSYSELIALVPQEKLSNFIYRNEGDLTFSKKIKEWGFETKTWSNGSAYADLDNDGDLDLIINNINDPAFLYENKAMDAKLNNYLRVKLKGQGHNQHAIGARVTIFYDDQLQLQELSPVRGYASTSECMIHFGVGNKKSIEKLEVRWPDGTFSVMKNVKTNQVLAIEQNNVVKVSDQVVNNRLLFEEVSATSGIDFIHTENDFDDYKREILIPHKMSTLGPCMATADVNGDQLEDLFVGGAAGQNAALYLQSGAGKFVKSTSNPWTADQASEDTGALFFDADGDDDLDLYVVSGGNDFDENSKLFQDRLYLNNGQGTFEKAANALPKAYSSGSKATVSDFDKDGDLDLFVGGRQVSGKYGYPGRSYILQNDNGKFSDVTQTVSNSLAEIGMVTDGIWIDFDGDNDEDLIIVGEWMPVTFFENNNGKLTNVTEAKGFSNTVGWWNTIKAADVDNDGDMDFVAGNLGLNIKYKASEKTPFKVYVKDFDADGNNDVYLGYYDNDGICYPVRGRQCSSQQLNFIKEEFPSYEAFSTAPIDKVLGERMQGAIEHNAVMFESVVIINEGKGQFDLKTLPNEAQMSPVFGAIAYDWNGDQRNDLFVAGNYYNREVETTRSDAGTGCILLGQEDHSFKALRTLTSGIYVSGDVRDVKMIMDEQGKPIILVANNNGPVQVFRPKQGELN